MLVIAGSQYKDGTKKEVKLVQTVESIGALINIIERSNARGVRLLILIKR